VRGDPDSGSLDALNNWSVRPQEVQAHAAAIVEEQYADWKMKRGGGGASTRVASAQSPRAITRSGALPSRHLVGKVTRR